MTENENRRSARRQQRGLQRQVEILNAAGLVMAEVGYENTTTNAIAARADISPGSLYQYFPNKEAIADALAQRYKDELHMEWDNVFAPEIAALPLNALVDLMVNALLTFNQARPGFAVLFFGDDISPELAAMGNELHDGMIARFGGLIAARAPQIPIEQRNLIADVIMKVHKAFMPSLLGAENDYRQQMLAEMKRVLHGYLASYVGEK